MQKLIPASIAASVAFLWIGLALAWGAAALHLTRTIGPLWGPWEGLGVALALAWTAVCATALGWIARRWNDCAAALAGAGLVLAVGLGWAWFTRHMSVWPMDAGMFRWFLDRFADGGYSDENLRQITWMYDYALWTHRALPLLHPLRVWCGPEHFGLVVQLLQAALGSVTLLVAWRMAHLLGGNEAVKWTVVGILSMPGFGMQPVGLNHQVWGMCWFVSGIWLWVEWFHGGMSGWKRCAVLGTVAIMLGPLLKWEGFIWPGYLVAGLLIAAGEAVWRRNVRDTWAGLIVLIAIPVSIVSATTSSMEQRITAANPQSINGGQMSFIARGWDFQAWGEYAERVEKLDVLTPTTEKTHFFTQFLASQTAYNGPDLLWKLFPIKLAKYMLAGYASLAEEILRENGAERTARVAQGMRVGWFVLLYAPLMLWGLRHLAGRCANPRTASLVLPVALFGVAVMFAGETSPRYSMPVQALLVAAGACGLAGSRKEEDGAKSVVQHPFAAGLGIVVVLYLLFASALLALRGTWQKYALADMRAAVLEGGRPVDDPRQAPFEAVFPDGNGRVEWAGQGGRATAYVRGKSWKEHGTIEVECPQGTWREVTLPARMELQWNDGEARRVAVRRTKGGGEIYIGYADVKP